MSLRLTLRTRCVLVEPGEVLLHFRTCHIKKGSLKGPFFYMARPEGFEPPTPKFVAWCSIQLSYGRLYRFLSTRSHCHMRGSNCPPKEARIISKAPPGVKPQTPNYSALSICFSR